MKLATIIAGTPGSNLQSTRVDCRAPSCIAEILSARGDTAIMFQNHRLSWIGEPVYMKWFKSNDYGAEIGKGGIQLDEDSIARYKIFSAFGMIVSQENEGVRVDYVYPNSPAYFSGIEKDYIIVRFPSQTGNKLTLQRFANEIEDHLEKYDWKTLHTITVKDESEPFNLLIFIPKHIYPLKPQYSGYFDTSDPEYIEMFVRLTSERERIRAHNAETRAMFSAIKGMVKSGGNFGEIVQVATELVEDVEDYESLERVSRSRLYALEGKVCGMRSSVVLCYSSTSSDTSYLGRGWLSTKQTVTSHCASPCSGHEGFCDMETGQKYNSAEAAERDNCRVGTEAELSRLLKIQQ